MNRKLNKTTFEIEMFCNSIKAHAVIFDHFNTLVEYKLHIHMNAYSYNVQVGCSTVRMKLLSQVLRDKDVL